MAFDFSKLNFLNRVGAKSRIAVLVLAVLGVIALVYIATRYFSGGETTVGPSRVAGAPPGLASIPGSTGATAAYQQAVTRSNEQVAQAAKISGGSAIPTEINLGNLGSSCIICSDKSANVKNLLGDWVRQGKVSQDIANQLQELASRHVTPEEYAARLDQLVRSGKLTPEQARALLDEYQKQYINAKVGDGEKMMDDMIKAGDLPLDTANQLLDAQRKQISTPDYAAMIQKLVSDKKISPIIGQQLLQQYNKQCSNEAIQKHIVLIQQMQQDGAVTQEVATSLIELTNKNTSLEGYSAKVSSLVTQGMLTPVAAGNLVDAYRQSKEACGAAGTINDLLRQAENEAYQEISDLLSAGKISPETASQITNLIQANASMDDFKAAINQLLQDKKITPDIAQLKIGDYEKIKRFRDIKQQLENLQANNASPAEYADKLKALVAAGLITPDQAAKMLQDYESLAVKAAPPVTATGALASLQQKVQATPVTPAGVSTEEFAAAQTQAVTETDQQRQERLQQLMSAMSGQATQLIGSWVPPSMAHKEGSYSTKETTTTKTTVTKTGEQSMAGEGGGTAAAAALAPIIKGGTIIFGVLDTAINSDYPDSPIMVTVVEGKYKGAKLLGKIVVTKGVTGQMDRVSLNFTLMNFDPWPKSRSVTAYAIDPDTARVSIASSVDYHYLMRFGAMMATSFLQGYATAVTTSGSTTTTGIFGTSTQSPSLSPGNKIMVGLGQMGQALGNATQNYINRPPTVRVDSGVSLGILFMSDVA